MEERKGTIIKLVYKQVINILLGREKISARSARQGWRMLLKEKAFSLLIMGIGDCLRQFSRMTHWAVK